MFVYIIELFHHDFNYRVMFGFSWHFNQSLECEAPSFKAWKAGKRQTCPSGEKEKSHAGCTQRSVQMKQRDRLYPQTVRAIAMAWSVAITEEASSQNTQRDPRLIPPQPISVTKPYWAKFCGSALADACVKRTPCRGPCLCELFRPYQFLVALCVRPAITPRYVQLLWPWNPCIGDLRWNGISFSWAWFRGCPLVVSSS